MYSPKPFVLLLVEVDLGRNVQFLPEYDLTFIRQLVGSVIGVVIE